jgi:hypothetical protein
MNRSYSLLLNKRGYYYWCSRQWGWQQRGWQILVTILLNQIQLFQNFPAVYLPIAIHRILGKGLLLPLYLKSVRVKSSQEAKGLIFVIATAKEAVSLWKDMGSLIRRDDELQLVEYPHC